MGLAMPTSRYCPHPERSTTLCFSFSLELATHTSRYSRYYQHPKRSTTLCLLLFGACDGLSLANLQTLSTSETIHRSMSSFSLELATGCATPTSRYYPHPERSTTLCLPSLWSLRRAAPHAHLQILSTSETIHQSRFSFSLELATGCATPTSRLSEIISQHLLSRSAHQPPV